VAAQEISLPKHVVTVTGHPSYKNRRAGPEPKHLWNLKAKPA